MKRYAQILFTVSMFPLLFSCQQGGNSSNEKDTATIDTLTYRYETYSLFSKHVIATSETTDTAFYKATYPLFEDEGVNRFVLTAVLGTDTLSLASDSEKFIGDYDQFIGDAEFPRIWTSETNTRVSQITPSYLGLSKTFYSYTGGAHGMHGTFFHHYDLSSKKTLALTDMVAPTYQNELTAIAERYFRQHEGLAPDASLADDYFFEDGKFYIPDNFALTADSMLFLYNIYDIKPYVYGLTQFGVPYSDFENRLTQRAQQIIQELKQTKSAL